MSNSITAICLVCCAFGRAFIFQQKNNNASWDQNRTNIKLKGNISRE